MTFNEAIRKVIDEKDKKIESLETSLKSCQVSVENSQGGFVSLSCPSWSFKLQCFYILGNQSLVKDLEDQLAQVQRKNAQLDSELREATQKLNNQVGKDTIFWIIVIDDASDDCQHSSSQWVRVKQPTSVTAGGKLNVEATVVQVCHFTHIKWKGKNVQSYCVVPKSLVTHWLSSYSILPSISFPNIP